MKGKILYLLIWIMTIYLGVLYYSPSLIGLAVLEFLLPIASSLLLWYISRKITASLYLPIGVCEKNQPVTVGIEIENKSRIPAAQVTVELSIRNGFYQSEEIQVFQGMAEGKGKTRLTTTISSSLCGPVILETADISISDLFQLSKRNLSVKGKETLSVMPELYETSVLMQESTRDFLIESEAYDKKKSGDDPSEVFQIREYRGGDRMQSIHWKLSARTDELMVKEYSLPIGCAVVLFLDMEYYPEEGYGYLDEFIEAGIAVSRGILEAGCEHYVVWFDRSRQDMERLEIKEIDDIYLLIERIYEAGPYPESVMMEELYQEKYRGETWHTRLLLNLQKELWKDGNLEMELSGNAREMLENNELFI